MKLRETEILWIKFRLELKSFIASRVNNDSLAEDLLQDVFVKIHDKIDQLHDDSKIKAWIYQLTRNVIADYYRGVANEDQILTDPHENTEDSQEFMSEALEDMINMMEELPSSYCEALCLIELDGLSQKKYAEKKKITYSAAKSRIQRARKKLKDMLMKCCHYQFDKYGTVINIFPANCCCCQDKNNPI